MKRVSFSAVAGNKKLKEMNYFSKGISMTIWTFLNVYNLGHVYQIFVSLINEKNSKMWTRTFFFFRRSTIQSFK